MPSSEDDSDEETEWNENEIFSYTKYSDADSDSSLSESSPRKPRFRRSHPITRNRHRSSSLYPNYQKQVKFVSGGLAYVHDEGKSLLSVSESETRKFYNKKPKESSKSLEDALLRDQDGVILGYTSSCDTDSSERSVTLTTQNSHKKASLVHGYSISSSSENDLSFSEDTEIYAFEQKAQERKKALQETYRNQHPAHVTNHPHQHGKTLGQESMQRLYGKGFKLLKQMGYKGGGLGKEGTGIITPLVSHAPRKNEGISEKKRQATSYSKISHTISPSNEEDEDDLDRKDPALSIIDSLLKQSESKIASSRQNLNKTSKIRTSLTAKRTWEKQHIRFKGAAEIAGDARHEYNVYLSCNASNISPGEIDHSDTLSLEDIKNLGDSTCKKRSQQYHKLLNQTNLEEAAAESIEQFRLIDMAGPTTRIIEDVFEFRQAMTEASLRSEKLCKKKQYNVPDLNESPLQQLADSIYAYIVEIENKIRLLTRNRITQEQRLKKALETKEYCVKEKKLVEEELVALDILLGSVTQLRNSEKLKWLKNTLNSPFREDGGTEDRHSVNDINQLREAALIKYKSINQLAEPKADDLINMQISEDGLSCDTSLDVPTFFSITDQNKQDIYINLFKEIIVTFSKLRQKLSTQYESLNVCLLATQFVGVLHNYLRCSGPNHRGLVESKNLSLVPYLVEFRANCIPEKSNDLRILWQEIILQDVIRGLTARLNELQINPAKQDLTQIQYFFEWINTVPLQTMITILETELFPKWLEVLRHWLDSAGVNLEEVYVWYNGWKNLFPEVLAKHSSVQNNFMRGLHLINAHLQSLAQRQQLYSTLLPPRAELENVGLDKPEKNLATPLIETPSRVSTDLHSESCHIPTPPVEDSEKTSLPASPVTHETRFSRISSQTQDSVMVASSTSRFFSASRLVEILEVLAEENDILFVPKRGRFYNGRQVFSFGTASIYIDSDVIYKLNPSCGTWLCISLSTLLEKVKNSC